MKKVYKWFKSHPWYEQIIMGIPAAVIILITIWFIITLALFTIIYAIDYKGCRTHDRHQHQYQQ